MQIHELNTFDGVPGADNFLPIDNGSDTGKISGESLLNPVNTRIDNLVANVRPDSIETLISLEAGITGTVTLSKSVSNFDFLDLYFKDDTYHAGGIRVPVAQFPVEITIPSQDPSDNMIYITRHRISVSGTSLTASGRLWEWTGDSGDSATVQSSVWVSLLTRVDGVKISSNSAAELTDIRIGWDGRTYLTAGEAVRGQITELWDLYTIQRITPVNLLDLSAIETGCYYWTNGKNVNASYNATGLIPVTPGETYYFTRGNRTVVQGRNFFDARFLIGYDTDGTTVKASASYVSGQTGYTVPTGVYYIRISNDTYLNPQNDIYSMVQTDANLIDFEPYFTPYTKYTLKSNVKVLASSLPDLTGTVDVNFDNLTFAICDNLFDINDPDNADGYYLNNGALGQNAIYYTTGYIEVEPNSDYAFYVNRPGYEARFVNEFDENKAYISSTQKQYVTHITTGPTTKYIRVTMYSGYMNGATVTRGPVSDPNATRRFYIPGKYLGSTYSVHAYLPKDIYVGVGRTIELYNELVCLEADKYHIDWNCAVGVDYARKFSVTGTANNVGDYPLSFSVVNDDLQIVFSAMATLHIVADNLAGIKKIVPIGDSLTNAKAWLPEVQDLSNGNIKYIGTRGTPALNYSYEGRSGATAAWYNANSTYTFDNNYVGAPDVPGNSNPFWDGSKFSLSHYISKQASTIGTPDAVQIFLGTNGMAMDPSVNVANIKTMVDAIVSEYPNMKIFVCNTIYRSNQNGYYSTGSDGYTPIQAYQFSEDMKVMNLQNALTEAFKSYANVVMTPLSVCMDREYDFGNIPTPVNPRLTSITFDIPNESVHPQLPGYLQMADVMYSAYIGNL